MPIRPRTPLVMLLAALVAVVVTGCGGGSSGEEASSGTDVNQLLEKTFSGEKKVDSGRIDAKLRFEPQGGDTGPVSIRLAGPFQTQGAGKLPKLDLDASLEGAGQSFKAGITTTGDKGFVSFQGTDYAVSDAVFKQFVAGYEQAQKQAKDSSNQQQPSLATLGIDPRRWLTGARNAGEAKVGDTDTIKITGGVDVEKLLDDLNSALEKVRALGVQGSEDIPEKLTDAQRRQVAEAVKDLKVEIYTGVDDTTLRRVVIDLDIQVPEGTANTGAQAGAITLDFSLLDLNEEQDIAAPANAKPFEELLSQLGGLGLGGLGGGSGSADPGSGSSSAGASAQDLEQYAKCIEDAGSDSAKVSKCADILAP